VTDTKRCPYCAEEIRAEAIKCRWCRSLLDKSPTAVGAISEPWTRKRDGAMLAGVCAGLAERFEISVTVIRLAFVISFLLGFGTSLLLYVVLWVVMPVEEDYTPLLDEGDRPYEPIE
jgi:phage shock protein PspC (stress-responsive transcriptional regulator)